MKRISKYQCEGQMDLFSFWQDEESVEKDIVISDASELEVGQEVWMVIRGDIKKYRIADEEPWDYTGRLVYRLEHRNGCYWTMPVNEIGTIFFLDDKSAQRKASKYLQTHPDVILASWIKPVETKVYSYIRDCDNREMFSFYAILEDGKVYIKNFMEYEHIIAYKNVETAKKTMKVKFFKQQAFEYETPLERGLEPTFKNMYRCKSDNDWMYAEAEYGGCV